MRVVFVTNSISGGGAEYVTNLVCEELFEHPRIQPHLFVINEFNSDFKKTKFEVTFLKRKNKSGLADTFLKYLKFNYLIWKTKPDVIVLNCSLPELFGAFTITKSIFFAVEHATNPWKNHLILGKFVRRMLYFRNTTWISVRDDLKIWPTLDTPDFIIRNAIKPPVKIFNQLSSQKLERLLFIGRLDEEKNPIFAIELSKKLHLPALIIGDGKLMNKLKKISFHDKEITFIGWQSDPWEYYKKGDLLIVPSEAEGDGLVVREAIFRRVPVMVSRIDAFLDLNLSPHFYAKTLEEFQNQIFAKKENICDFIVPDQIRLKLIQERNPVVISLLWAKILLSK